MPTVVIPNTTGADFRARVNSNFALLDTAIAALPGSSLLNTIVLFGDSITLANGGDAWTTPDANLSAQYSSQENGFFNWANTVLGQRFIVTNNAGIGGNTTTQMLARIQTDVIAFHPKYCFVLGGTNDIATVGSSTLAIANLTAIYAALKAAGIQVIAATIPPHSIALSSPADWYLFNKWIRDYGNSNGHIVIDLAAQILSATDNRVLAVVGTLVDEVHLALLGAVLMGVEVARVLTALVPPRPVLPCSNFDTENLVVNPLMTGSVAIAHSGVSGVVATSFDVKQVGASGTVGSKVAATDTLGAWQQITYSGAAADGTAWIEQAITPAPTPGDRMVAYCEYQVDAGLAAKVNLHALTPIGTATNRFDAQSSLPGASAVAQIPATGIMRTGIFTMPSDGTALTLQFSLVGASGTVRARRFRIVKL